MSLASLTFRLIIRSMRIRAFVCLLAISSISAFASETYHFGRIVQIIAPVLDVGDTAQMFCAIRITSLGVVYSFTIEGRQMKGCDRRFWLQQGIWFRVADQHILLKQTKGNDLDGGLVEKSWKYPSVDVVPSTLLPVRHVL